MNASGLLGKPDGSEPTKSALPGRGLSNRDRHGRSDGCIVRDLDVHLQQTGHCSGSGSAIQNLRFDVAEKSTDRKQRLRQASVIEGQCAIDTIGRRLATARGEELGNASALDGVLFGDDPIAGIEEGTRSLA